MQNQKYSNLKSIKYNKKSLKNVGKSQNWEKLNLIKKKSNHNKYL